MVFVKRQVGGRAGHGVHVSASQCHGGGSHDRLEQEAVEGAVKKRKRVGKILPDRSVVGVERLCDDPAKIRHEQLQRIHGYAVHLRPAYGYLVRASQVQKGVVDAHGLLEALGNDQIQEGAVRVQAEALTQRLPVVSCLRSPGRGCSPKSQNGGVPARRVASGSGPGCWGPGAGRRERRTRTSCSAMASVSGTPRYPRAPSCENPRPRPRWPQSRSPRSGPLPGAPRRRRHRRCAPTVTPEARCLRTDTRERTRIPGARGTLMVVAVLGFVSMSSCQSVRKRR